MVSDIEFFTVYPSGFDRFKEFDKAMEDAARESFPGETSSLFHVDNTYVCRERLPFMERKLLTFDAVAMGKTVVGPDVISLLPRITIDNINLRDIRDILTHRIFSVLYYGFPLKERGELEQYRYSLAKNSLDLMTVLLVNHGQLVSGFANRLERVKRLQVDADIKQYFEYCLSVKLGTDSKARYSIAQMESMFVRLVKDLKKEFRIPVRNGIVNARHVTRRYLGIVKRTIKYKHWSGTSQLKRLVICFEKKEQLNKRDLLDNLVRNGYPSIVEDK